MGNHELNAIAWFLEDPERPGEYLRPHRSPEYGRKNYWQHRAFLEAVGEDDRLHREIVWWFLSLPLWLDLGEIRVVHACWHEPFMRHLADPARGAQLDEALMVPVFFGHYWFTGTPCLFGRKAVCLDYSIAKGGALAAYRRDGESELDAGRLVWVDSAGTVVAAEPAPPSHPACSRRGGRARGLSRAPEAGERRPHAPESGSACLSAWRPLSNVGSSLWRITQTISRSMPK